jgi:hypothetical protein
MKIVVIGGTGLIGSKTVAILRQGGHDVVAASPKGGVNSITGEGLKEAMAGAQVVIDLTNTPSFEDSAVRYPGRVGGAVYAVWPSQTARRLLHPCRRSPPPSPTPHAAAAGSRRLRHRRIIRLMGDGLGADQRDH